jgi:hypothetical protein
MKSEGENKCFDGRNGIKCCFIECKSIKAVQRSIFITMDIESGILEEPHSPDDNAL